MNGSDIRASGCEHQGTGSISGSADTVSGVVTWLTLGVSASKGVGEAAPPTTNLGDWTVCSGSNQCRNGCCSGQYSNGVLKCTPLNGGYRSDMCIGPAPGGSTTTTLGDWTVCSNSRQCRNGCCSGQYSSGVLKCTPLNGGYRSDICVAPGPGARYLRSIGDLSEEDSLNWNFTNNTKQWCKCYTNSFDNHSKKSR